MKKVFGHQVAGYDIPVLNEREIRAAAGILFLAMFISIQQAGMLGNFTPIKYMITFFLIDISIRLFISPNYSPFLILGRWIVRNQTPEYVGAAQKKFAWYIGLFLSAIVFILMVPLNTFSPVSGLACFFCLIFLFFEASFGICIGCLIYRWVKKEKAQYCPGEVCEISERQPIQRVSGGQLAVFLAFILVVALLVIFLGEFYGQKPIDLMGLQ